MDEENPPASDLSNRSVSNGCAICLDEYHHHTAGAHEQGVIVGTKCGHLFHSRCMKSFIKTKARKGMYDIPCPCCRQDFFDSVVLSQEEEDEESSTLSDDANETTTDEQNNSNAET